MKFLLSGIVLCLILIIGIVCFWWWHQRSVSKVEETFAKPVSLVEEFRKTDGFKAFQKYTSTPTESSSSDVSDIATVTDEEDLQAISEEPPEEITTSAEKEPVLPSFDSIPMFTPLQKLLS